MEAKALAFKNCPKDGPATFFEADHFAKDLLEKNSAAETYGLVLVAGWPAPEAWQRIYRDKVRPRLAACFPQDFAPDGSSSTVYMYPPEALHVTVATFWSIHQTAKERLATNPVRMGAVERRVKDVVGQAWQRYLDQTRGKCDFILDIESAQIGSKAGILLWNENSGHLDAFRRLLEVTCREESKRLGQATDEHSLFMRKILSGLSIPGIVHSTVIRFADTPKTDGSTVQEIFQRTVLECLATELVQQPVILESMTLALERRPYMHIPYDEKHVLWTSKD
jgi:hypothetical protein